MGGMVFFNVPNYKPTSYKAADILVVGLGDTLKLSQSVNIDTLVLRGKLVHADHSIFASKEVVIDETAVIVEAGDAGNVSLPHLPFPIQDQDSVFMQHFPMPTEKDGNFPYWDADKKDYKKGLYVACASFVDKRGEAAKKLSDDVFVRIFGH